MRRGRIAAGAPPAARSVRALWAVPVYPDVAALQDSACVVQGRRAADPCDVDRERVGCSRFPIVLHVDGEVRRAGTAAAGALDRALASGAGSRDRRALHGEAAVVDEDQVARLCPVWLRPTVDAERSLTKLSIDPPTAAREVPRRARARLAVD